MKTIILDKNNIGNGEELTQEQANKEMLRGCEIPSHPFPTAEELEEAKKIEGPF